MQLKSPPRRFSKKVSPAEEASIETPVARKDAMFHNSKKTGRLKYGGREPTLHRAWAASVVATSTEAGRSLGVEHRAPPQVGQWPSGSISVPCKD